MPKIKVNVSHRLRQYVQEFKDTFSTDGKILYCQPCGKSIKADQRSQVTQHLSGNKHIIAASRSASKQVLLSETGPSSSHSQPSKSREFYSDICKTFISADIPLFKLNNKEVKNFLAKYTNFDPPDESTIRKHYLPKCYEETLRNIRAVCENEKIWVCIDETTDSTLRKLGNVVIGVLKNDKIVSERSFLIACKEMPAANHITVARLFNESMHILWPNGVKYDNVLILLSDAAPYMKKAAEALSVSYPNMLHVTCVVHGLHRVCETIRSLYPKVDKLVSNGKKIFVKAPTRIDLFRNTNPNIPLPPTPIVTRWGTLLSAVVYYAEHFDDFKTVLDQLNEDDASSIEIVKNLLSDGCLRNELAYISANLSFLCDSIKKLEQTTNLLTESVKEISEVETKINSLTGSKIECVKTKLKSVFEKNNGFEVLKTVAQVIEGKQVDIGNLRVGDIPILKYARVTSCDVERSFSQYRALFRDNRQRFQMDHLEHTFVVHCNSKQFSTAN